MKLRKKMALHSELLESVYNYYICQLDNVQRKHTNYLKPIIIKPATGKRLNYLLHIDKKRWDKYTFSKLNPNWKYVLCANNMFTLTPECVTESKFIIS